MLRNFGAKILDGSGVTKNIRLNVKNSAEFYVCTYVELRLVCRPSRKTVRVRV